MIVVRALGWGSADFELQNGLREMDPQFRFDGRFGNGDATLRAIGGPEKGSKCYARIFGFESSRCMNHHLQTHPMTL